jgi:hypothetical protein
MTRTYQSLADMIDFQIKRHQVEIDALEDSKYNIRRHFNDPDNTHLIFWTRDVPSFGWRDVESDHIFDFRQNIYMSRVKVDE